MSFPDKIYDYKKPNILLETDLASQYVHPSDKADLWLYRNIYAGGTREEKNLLDSHEKKYSKLLDACDLPFSRSRWKECVKAVTKLQNARNKQYLNAKDHAETWLRWYHSGDLIGKAGLEAAFSPEEPFFGYLDAGKVMEDDKKCPTSKPTSDATSADLEQCQASLLSAYIDRRRYLAAKQFLSNLYDEWLMSSSALEEEFAKLSHENKQKPLFIPKRKIPLGQETQAILDAREKARAQELIRKEKAKRVFLQSKAAEKLRQFFTINPEEQFDPPRIPVKRSAMEKSMAKKQEARKWAKEEASKRNISL